MILAYNRMSKRSPPKRSLQQGRVCSPAAASTIQSLSLSTVPHVRNKFFQKMVNSKPSSIHTFSVLNRHGGVFFSLSLICLLTCLHTKASAQSRRDPIRLTHGPMLGMSTSNSVRVWGRTSEPGPFFVRYGTSANKLDLQSQPKVTTIEHDNTGIIVLEDLRADTTISFL